MKKIKYLLLLVFGGCLSLALFSFFYNHGDLKWTDSNVYFVAPDENFDCRDVSSDSATCIYISFCYKPFYKYSLGIFNDFTHSYDLKKVKITAISVKLSKAGAPDFEIANCLESYMEQNYLIEFAQKLYANAHSKEDFNFDTYYGISDLALNIGEVSELLPKVLKVDPDARKYLPEKFFEQPKVEILNTERDSFGRYRKAFCYNSNTDNIFMTEMVYAGSLDFFMTMYNLDVINTHNLDMIPGLIFKLDLPRGVKIENYEKLVFEAFFEDESAIKIYKEIKKNN